MKFKSILLATALAFASMIPTSTNAALLMPNPSPGNSVFHFQEVADFNWSSRREAITLFQDEIGGYDESFLCDELPAVEGPCAFQLRENNNQFYGSSILPVCESATQEFCVESLSFQDSDGDFIEAVHYGHAGGDTFPAIEDLRVYAAGRISLWNAIGFPNSSGSPTYAVAVRSRQGFDHYQNRFTTTAVDFIVIPFVEKLGDYEAPKSFEFLDNDEKNRVGGTAGKGGGECAWVDDGKCGFRVDFEGLPTIKLAVRSDSQLDGWYRGRMSETAVSVETFSDDNSLVTIQGKVAELPQFAVEISNQEVPKDLVRDLRLPTDESGALNVSQRIGIFSTDSYRNKAYRVLSAFKDAAFDTAAGSVKTWALESINSPGNQSCYSNAEGLVGLVTTNALVYDGTAPRFEESTLKYKVAGVHYLNQNGDLNLGTYDLVMRSDVARCLYGFTSAPVSATVTVTGDVEQNVATTVVSERDGWLKLAAYGFTFSEKEIQVKITQPQIRTLSDHPGRATALTTKQKAEIRAVLAKGKGNTKFICTGIRLEGQSASMNRAVRLRAKLACEYAKSLDPKLSTFYQSKITKARSYNGRVLVVSK